MPDRIGNEGQPTARILLIGEAPGRWEHVYGRPFIGPSYTDKLLPWWRNAGLDRSMFFITNVLDYQPARIDAVSEAEMRAAFERLHATIAALPGPDGGGPFVIVPTGNYALYALTGNGCVSFHSRDGKWKRPGITEWRGSILDYVDQRNRPLKVIPTIHPAAVFRTMGYEWVCQADWKRIAAESLFRETRQPECGHIVAPSKSEAIEWIRYTRSEAKKRAHLPSNGQLEGARLSCSLDVETPKRSEYEVRQKPSGAANPKCVSCGHTKKWHKEEPGCTKKATKKLGGAVCECMSFVTPMGAAKKVKISEERYLGCTGYCWNPNLAICIPNTMQFWQDPAVYAQVKEEMRAFHADENVDFFGQNFTFDAWWCEEEGFPLHDIRWCLMKMHRVLVPFSEWHDLAFQGSLYTRQRYWKDEAKDPDSVAKYAHNNEALWHYNCIDNYVQRVLLMHHVPALEKIGRLEYYNEIERPIDPVLVALSHTGIRGDIPGRAAEFARVRDEAAQVADEIEIAAGVRLIGKTAISTKKMKVWLYETNRLPLQYTKNAKKQKVVSTDVIAIKKLMERFPGHESLQIVGKKVLQHRRLNTIANYVKAERLSADGRQYAFFKQDTSLGRLSSSETLKGEGANLQNVDRKLRKYYLPNRALEAV